MRHSHAATGARRRGGVTPLELLLAVTAAVVLVTMVLPWAERAMVRLRAGWAADDVAAAMVEARSLAVQRHRDVVLYIDEAGDSVDVQDGTFRRLSAAIRLSGPPPGPSGLGEIRFHGDGDSDGGQVVVATADIAWFLTVDPRTGYPKRLYAGRR